MKKKFGKSVLALLAWSVICQPILADNTTLDGTVKFFVDQGKSAMHDKHYHDATGWFDKAVKQAQFDKKGDRLMAGLYEMLGYAYLNDKNYQSSMEALTNGYQKYEASMGAYNADSARIFDQIGEIGIETKDYQSAETALVSAYDRSMGSDPKVVADPKIIGYRANRLAYICSLTGGLSDAVRYSTAIAKGKSSDDMYADAIGTLRRKEKAGGDATVINAAIKDVFAYWKIIVDRGGSPANKAHYETCWQQTYGATQPAVITGSTDSGHIIKTNPFAPDSENPGTKLDLEHLRKSPWGTTHSFVSGQSQGLNSLDETLKKLGL